MKEPFLKIESSKLNANPDSAGWSQSYDFVPQEEEKVNLKGQMYAVIATKTYDEGVENMMAGRELLSRLHKEYYSTNSGGTLSSLKDAVNKVLKEFSSWEGVEIGTSVFLDDAIYFATGGGARVFVYRDNNLVELLDNKDNKVRSTSGKPKEGDIYILATNSFFDTLPRGVIKASLSGNNLHDSIETLAPQIHSKEDVGNSGAVLLSVLKSVNDEIMRKVDIESKLVEENKDELEVVKTDTDKRGDLLVNEDVKKHGSNNFVNRVSQKLKKLFEKKVYVGPENKKRMMPKQKRVSLSVAVILIAILSVSIYFGVKQKRKEDVVATYEESLKSASHAIDESLNLYSLNAKRSRELFQEGRGLVLGISDKGIDDENLKELINKIEENEGRILGEYNLNADIIVDLSLLSEGFYGDRMTDSNGILYVLDSGGGKVASIEVDSKRAEIIAGPIKVGDSSEIASYSDNVFVVNNKGINEVVDEVEKVIDKDWEGDVLIYAFAGNMYLVEKSNSYLWRYPGDGKNFGDRKNWLSEETVPNLTDAKEIAIDGKIWILKGNGEIFMFNLGNRERFDLTLSILSDFSPESFYTSESTKYLYVLDSINSQVVVFDKEGNYIARYLSSDISSTKKITVSEAQKKLILLNGDKLLVIELKHF